MGVIDWPAPYSSNVAFFKTEPELPNGRGGTRRFNIPLPESKILGLKSGDAVSIDMYDKSEDREISFQKKLTGGAGSTQVRFTIPLSQIDLEPEEFDKGSFHQVVLRKSGLIKRLPSISPKRVYDVGIFKRSISREANIESDVDSTLLITVPMSQARPLGLSVGDTVNVTMFQVEPVTASASDRIISGMTSVSRSAFRSVLVGSGRSGNSVRFSIPSRRRRLRGYSKDDTYQVAVIPA